MNILHIHTTMAGGGIGAMICALANRMSRSEQVTVCTIFQPKEREVFWNKLSSIVAKTKCANFQNEMCCLNAH